ncbi:hypothetical protein [Absidia glauca]|uniref:Serine/threonine-protein phosphatase n=1 Tax=Absidia glauca TaxID=4829 RepID=A0A163JS61_ABSGL|nr:hypothetical protein [Absidia glauca]
MGNHTSKHGSRRHIKPHIDQTIDKNTPTAVNDPPPSPPLEHPPPLAKPAMSPPSSPPPSPPHHHRHESTASTVSSSSFWIDDCIERLLEAGHQGKPKALCLSPLETLLELSPPVKIVGDTHGQFSDLLRLFQMAGAPPSSNYLFLGDYIDRGQQSLETFLLLLCYKIKYPETFFLLRGNHESQNVSRGKFSLLLLRLEDQPSHFFLKVYGFYDECKRRLSVKSWRVFMDVCNTLPIAAIVADKIFCVHGGLSPWLESLDEIKAIERPIIETTGFINDLLWSDPTDTTLDWCANTDRGVSYCFGTRAVEDFLAKFDLDLICRGHMVVEDGYCFFAGRRLVTVFSAPNYCGSFDNLGAVMTVDDNLMCRFQLLTPANHPLCRSSQSE